MELQKTKHELKLEHWRGVVQECRSSAMTVKSWCAERGICIGTYYRWQRLVWEKCASQEALAAETSMTFGEYKPQASPSCTPAITLHMDAVKVEIHSGADQSVIENTLSALKKLC